MTITARPLGRALETLLAGAIDYAGLFPPAALSLDDAVANYSRYLHAPDGWALGRFVAPAARLPELAETLGRLGPDQRGPVVWRVSAVLGPDVEVELHRVREFNARVARHGARVDSLEAKVATPEDVDRLSTVASERLDRYGEVALTGDLVALLTAVARSHSFAKIRMGGTTAEAFPEPDWVVDFLHATHTAQVPFKATAGLHHPIRGIYRLTYQTDSAAAWMYGYLNLGLAVLLARASAASETIRAALLEEDPRAIRRDGGLAWREWRFDLAHIAALRAESFHGFGSCSFREPMDEVARAETG